jgi:DNA-binding LytR/AlgR family response regulator
VDYLHQACQSTALATPCSYSRSPANTNEAVSAQRSGSCCEPAKRRESCISHISGIKAEENYTDVLVADGSTVFMRRTISEWEELLPKPPFFTPHRSLIVNLQAVGDLVLQSRAEVSFKLEGRPHSFKLGQRPAARLRKALRLSRGL